MRRCGPASLFREARTARFFTITVNGAAYLTDRHLAIRSDIVETPGAAKKIEGDRLWGIPPEKPPASILTLGPVYMHLLTQAGFDICGQPDDDPRTIQHIYRGDEHAGWLMPTVGPYGVTIADLPEVRKIASDLPVECDLPDLDVAEALLAWERKRAAERASPAGTAPPALDGQPGRASPAGRATRARSQVTS